MQVFIPNPGRTVSVPVSSPCAATPPSRYPPGDVNPSPLPLCLPAKSSSDMLDYTIRVGDWFDGTGDAIISFSVKGLEGQTGDTPLTLAASFSGSQAVTLILTSGVPKQRYTFTAEITTRMGLVYAVPLALQINDNTPATPPRSFEVPSVPVDADSYKALFESLPTAEPTNEKGLWNNGGLSISYSKADPENAS